MERVDATGVFLGCRGSAFVPSPPPGFPEKLTEGADSSRPPSSSALIGHRGQADVGAAAGGLDDSSTSFSHRGTISRHRRLSNTTPPGPGAPPAHNAQTQGHTLTHTLCPRSNASQRRRRTQQSFIIKDEHRGFPLNRVYCSNALWVLTDRARIHFRILLRK